MTAENDGNPRFWGAGTILTSWLDWQTWQSHGVFDSDRPVFVALLDAAELLAGRDAEAAMRRLTTSGHTPREVTAAGVQLVATVFRLAEPGLVDDLRRVATSGRVGDALSLAVLEVVSAAEVLASFQATPLSERVPDDCGPLNELLDGSATSIARHAQAALCVLGGWWAERRDDFTELRRGFRDGATS